MYRLSLKRQALVISVRDIAKMVIGPVAAKADKRSADLEESMESLAREGFMGLMVPHEHGGTHQRRHS